MITISGNRNGSYVASALVTSDYENFDWYESVTYYFYTKTEIRKLFRAYLEAEKLTIIKEY